MDNIDKLISGLTTNLEPVNKVNDPLTLFARWMLGSLVWLGILLIFFGIRPDLSAKLDSFLFAAEIVSLAIVIISTAIAVTFLSYPDIRQKPLIIYLPVIPLLAFIVIMYFALSNDVPHPPAIEPGYMCLLCISFLSSFPSLLIFFILRKQATTHPFITGLLALMASSALGNLAFRLSENNDDIAHLITWHYLPILGFSFMGLLLGRRFLKW